MKKNRTLDQTLEDLARKHMGVSSLSKVEKDEIYCVSVTQIKKALKDAVLHGEKVGYETGYTDGGVIRNEKSNPTIFSNFDLV
jgi:hypothetical protein